MIKIKRKEKIKIFILFLNLEEVNLSVNSFIRSIPNRIKTKNISRSTFIVSKNISIIHAIIIMIIFMSILFSGEIFSGIKRIKKSPIKDNVKPIFIFRWNENEKKKILIITKNIPNIFTLYEVDLLKKNLSVYDFNSFK